MPTIFVDADACPVVDDVVEIAGERPVRLVHNAHHRHERSEHNVECWVTGDRQDQADHMIHRRSEPGDVIVTDDLGLAALVLARGCRVVRFRGGRPNEDTIEHQLAMRHHAARQRRSGRRMSGPPAFTEKDRARFRRALRDCLEETP